MLTYKPVLLLHLLSTSYSIPLKLLALDLHIRIIKKKIKAGGGISDHPVKFPHFSDEFAYQ